MRKGIFLIVALLVSWATMLYAENTSLYIVDGLKVLSVSKEGDVVNEATPAWEFYFVPKNFSSTELNGASNHKLGREVACLYTAFEEVYVVKEEVVPGDPMRRTIIRKPGIYNAVRKIERLMKERVKRDEVPVERAAADFERVLNVALAAVDTECDTFEKALQDNRKDVDRLLALFQRVSLKSL